MKKQFLLYFILLTTFSVKGQVAWNIFAGPQLHYTHYTINGLKQKNDIKYGFQLGAGLKVPFENRLYFAPSGFYSFKGYKVTLSTPSYPPDSSAIDNNTTLHTVELAALLQYDFSDQPGHFFLRGGPALDFQLFGRETFHTSTGGSVSRNMKFGYGDYGHYSANLTVHLGYESGSGLFVFAYYSHGLANINNSEDVITRIGGPVIKHRVAGVSLGYTINRRKIVIDTKNKE